METERILNPMPYTLNRMPFFIFNPKPYTLSPMPFCKLSRHALNPQHTSKPAMLHRGIFSHL